MDGVHRRFVRLRQFDAIRGPPVGGGRSDSVQPEGITMPFPPAPEPRGKTQRISNHPGVENYRNKTRPRRALGRMYNPCRLDLLTWGNGRAGRGMHQGEKDGHKGTNCTVSSPAPIPPPHRSPTPEGEVPEEGGRDVRRQRGLLRGLLVRVGCGAGVLEIPQNRWNTLETQINKIGGQTIGSVQVGRLKSKDRTRSSRSGSHLDTKARAGARRHSG